MRPLLALLALLAATFVAGPTSAQDSAASSEATLTVDGQATVTRAPEVATVSVGFTTNAGVATNAQSHNNAIYEAVLAALHRIGIADSAIKTTSYSMNYNPPPTPAPGPSRSTESTMRAPVRSGDGFGYVVNRQLSVTTEPDGVGRVIDGASAAGATEMGGIAFGLKDRRAAFTAALGDAIADADQQAHTLASTGRFRIVRLKSIQAGSAPYNPGPMMMRMAAPATNLPPSDVEVSASVTVTYVISP